MLMMQYLLCHLSGGRFSGSQRGATLIEYALIIAVIAIAVITFGNIGDVAEKINGLFGTARDCLKDGTDCQ